MSHSSSGPGPAESLLATLNRAQCDAVTSNADTLAILAGPGSGKTHTLTSRVVWLVDNVGYQPADVVVATFTVKSAREMKERIGKALGNDRARKIVLGTFHSIARRYLAAYGRRIGLGEKFGIADDGDSRAAIQRICKRLQLAVDPPVARSWISKKKAKGSSSSEGTHPPTKRGHNNGRQQQRRDTVDPGLETCYREYQDHLERSNLLDYDDLLTKCVELLQKHPACVSNVQAVLIDEYQDTNVVQYDLMKLFAQARQRITIVGDPDQSIYGWRSAEKRNLYRFLREHARTDEVKLEENYRSSRAILDASLKVIQQDKKRYEKVLLPTHNKGSRPVLRRLRTAAVEADWIMAEIRRAMLLTGGMMSHDDVAILLRSAALSRHVESALGKAGIAYRMVGGFKFYERAEVKVLVDYLRVIHQPDNNDALARVMNVPRRGIGEATIKSLLEEAETSKMSVWSLVNKHCRGDRQAKTNIKKAMEQKLSGDLIRLVTALRKNLDEPPTTGGSPCYHLVDLIESLLSTLNMQRYLQDTYPEDHEGRWANVREFVNVAGDFMRELNRSNEDDRLPEIDGVQQMAETDALGKFLSNVALASDAQKGETGNKPVVTISTIHAAKGLEWPVVFVPAVYNGSIPHARSEDMDEERRLLYVAMTRAKSLLYLSCPLYGSQAGGLGGGGEQTELSHFIPPDVHPFFSKTGPSFSTDVIKEIGAILGREEQVPSAEKIFRQMPSMERLEDNLHPIDPNDTRSDHRSKKNNKGGGGGAHWRGRLGGSADDGQDGEDSAMLSRFGNTTTMQASGNFTVASLPGFTTAGAHQSAMVAAAQDIARSVDHGGGQGGRHRDENNPSSSSTRSFNRTGATKRQADQRSMLGFVTKRQKSDPSHLAPQTTAAEAAAARQDARPLGRQVSAMAALPSLSIPQAQHQHGAPPPQQKPAAPSIAPDLAAHKLGSNRMSKPAKSAVAATTKSISNNGADEEEGPRKKYPFFSSSPSQEEKGQRRQQEEDGSAKEQEEGTEEDWGRPASCLHVTTTTMQSYRGFTRPAAIKREGGVAPIDRLRKPFKPLTINRGGGR